MRKARWHADVIAVLLLTLVFVLSAMLTLVWGAQAYQAATDRDAATLDRMTLEQYLLTRLWHSGCEFEVRDWSGNPVQSGPVLCCFEIVDGEVYEQLMYEHEGHVYELLSSSGFEFEPGDGDWMLSTDRLDFEQSDGGLWVNTGDRSFYISTSR